MEEMETDNMIYNLNDPVLAERFRIRKVVEDKFVKLEEEVVSQILRDKQILERNKSSKKSKEEQCLRNNGERKAEFVKEKVQKSEIPMSKKQNEAPLNERISTPESSKHFKSPDVLKTEGMKQFPVFEVIKTDQHPFVHLKPPRLIKRMRKGNTALYEFQHNNFANEPVLTSHILPGIDIKPELTIEYVPGLSIPGIRKEKRPNINVISEKHSDDQHNQPAIDDPVSITNSTTSKFEEMENFINESNRTKERSDAQEEELKKQLRTRVKEILIRKYNLNLDIDESNKNEKISKLDKIFDYSTKEKSTGTCSEKSNSVKSSDKEDTERNHHTEYTSSFENDTEDETLNGLSQRRELVITDEKERIDLLEEDTPQSSAEGEFQAPQKPLSTIFEASSTLTNISSIKQSKSNKFVGDHVKDEILPTQHTSLTPELEDEDTLAPISLEHELLSDRNEHSKHRDMRYSDAREFDVNSSTNQNDVLVEKESASNNDSKQHITNVELYAHQDCNTTENNVEDNNEVNPSHHSLCSEQENLTVTDRESHDDDNEFSSKLRNQRKNINEGLQIVRSIIHDCLLEKMFGTEELSKCKPSDIFFHENLPTLSENEVTIPRDFNRLTDVEIDDLEISEGPLDLTSDQSHDGNEDLIERESILQDKTPDANIRMADEAPYTSNKSTFTSDKSFSNSLNNATSIKTDDFMPVDKISVNSQIACSEVRDEESQVQTIESSTSYSLRGPMSSGEILPEALKNLHSEGEAHAAEVSIKSQSQRVPSDGERMDTISASEDILDSDGTENSSSINIDGVLSSLSSGEWSASPRQLQRLVSLAASLRLQS